jgi:hypothetical protein
MSRARDKANSTVSNFASTGIDDNADANAITIDSSENVLVGTTNANPAENNVAGIGLLAGNSISVTDDGGAPIQLNRKTSDGSMAVFRKNGAAVGVIGTTSSELTVGTAETGLRFNSPFARIIPHNTTSDASTNGTIDIGASGNRFKDLYLSGGAYLGGTGSANKLSDYEEGLHVTTATPSTSGTISFYSYADTFAYTKIGRLVHISGEVAISSVSSPVGSVVDFTVPFACSSLSETSERSGGGVFWTDNGTGFFVLPAFTFSGAIIRIFKDASSFSANDSLSFGFSYVTDA